MKKILLMASVAVAMGLFTACDSDRDDNPTLTIPETFRKSGRVFQLLGIGQNGVVTYSDLDADGKTITFTTENPTASYALVFSGN